MPILRPCRNTAAFELLPDGERRLDLEEVEGALTQVGYRRVVRAGVMLIMRREHEVSVYRSGKMLIKTRDPDVARDVAGELVGATAPDEGDRIETQGLDRLAARGAGAG